MPSSSRAWAPSASWAVSCSATCRASTGSRPRWRSRFSAARSASSVSAWVCTETYSPAAIDIAPATVPATPVARIVLAGAPLAATPTTRPATETMPSLAPSTAARSQPTRSERCSSGCREWRLMAVSVRGSRGRRAPLRWKASSPTSPATVQRAFPLSSPSHVADTPITDRSQLVEVIASGEKPRTQWRIGTEHEKFGFRLDDLRPPTFDGERGIEALLNGLVRFGWEPVQENGNTIALLRDGASVTLEPAGQLELSGGRRTAAGLPRHGLPAEEEAR
ncbi:hypothetical protein G6F65_017292 [Rhizopus arrhizus]|nr:hypothetical protein G6F65_017292 [Rhizopus arrhizus]